jgi:hypothetical protein
VVFANYRPHRQAAACNNENGGTLNLETFADVFIRRLSCGLGLKNDNISKLYTKR